jgi:hypothetical protein
VIVQWISSFAQTADDALAGKAYDVSMSAPIVPDMPGCAVGLHTAVLAFDQQLPAWAVQAGLKALRGELGNMLADAVVAWWLLICALTRRFWGRSRVVGWRNPGSFRPNGRSSAIGDWQRPQLGE